MIRLIESKKEQIRHSITVNQALLLDFDGTLVDYRINEKKALEKLFSFNNISNDIISDAINDYKQINAYYWGEFEKKKYTIEEVQYKRFEDLIFKYNLKNDPKKINKQYLDFLVQTTSIEPEIISSLHTIKEFGVKLIVITNGVHWTQQERLKNCGLTDLIDTFFTSESVGYPKPHPKMFLDAQNYLESVNCPTDELWVVGDNFEADIKGAHDVGFHSCWISNNVELEIEKYPSVLADSFLEFVRFYNSVKESV